MSRSRSSHDLEVIFLGEVGVGKTTLFYYLDKNKFVDAKFMATVGADIMYKTVSVGDRQLKVKVCDTGGDDKFRTITTSYYRRANIALLVYSVDDRYTFETLSDRLMECLESNESPESLVFVLIGNKIDIENEVPPEIVEEFCKEYKISHFYSVSARTGKNVNEMFETVVKSTSEKLKLV